MLVTNDVLDTNTVSSCSVYTAAQLKATEKRDQNIFEEKWRGGRKPEVDVKHIHTHTQTHTDTHTYTQTPTHTRKETAKIFDFFLSREMLVTNLSLIHI